MSRQVVSYDDIATTGFVAEISSPSTIGPINANLESGTTAGVKNATAGDEDTGMSMNGVIPTPAIIAAPGLDENASASSAVGFTPGGDGDNNLNDFDGKGSRQIVSGPNAERGALAPTPSKQQQQYEEQQALRPPKKKRRQNQNQNQSQSQKQSQGQGQDQRQNPKNGKGQKQQRGRYNARAQSSAGIQHWDDPGTDAQIISYDDDAVPAKANADYEDGEVKEANEEVNMDLGDSEEDDEDSEDSEDESRNLTHEEIWDDSALIAAWDAANEEYEAIHGKAKHWKKDRVHKSSLWYNIPPEKPKGKKKKKNVDSTTSAQDVQETSTPLDYNSFVPTHDPSLAVAYPAPPPPIPETTQTSLMDITARYKDMHSNEPGGGMLSGTAGTDLSSVTANGAFDRALGAMYWCGYWTAVYHLRRDQEGEALGTDSEIGLTERVRDEDKAEMLVSTQR